MNINKPHKYFSKPTYSKVEWHTSRCTFKSLKKAFSACVSLRELKTTYIANRYWDNTGESIECTESLGGPLQVRHRNDKRRTMWFRVPLFERVIWLQRLSESHREDNISELGVILINHAVFDYSDIISSDFYRTIWSVCHVSINIWRWGIKWDWEEDWCSCWIKLMHGILKLIDCKKVLLGGNNRIESVRLTRRIIPYAFRLLFF